MITKCQCTECGNNLEFDSAHAGNTVLCPHCSKYTLLYTPKMVAAAQQPIPVKAIAKKEIQCAFTKIFAIIFFCAGAFMAVNGMASDVESKTVFQQGNANMGFYAGVILMALSFVMWGIARITEGVVNGK